MKRTFAQKLCASLLTILMSSLYPIPVSFADAHNSYRIKIPKKYGKVKARYKGKTDKLVIHIQDAHTSFDAQKNIANIIEHLVKTKATDTIFVEGAEGEIDLDPFRLFPDAEMRQKVAENMTAYGYLTGAELAGIGMEEEFKMIGAENMRLYDRNLDKFQATMSKRDDILSEIEKIQEIIDELKEPIYPEELRSIDKLIQDFEAGGIPFADYIKSIIDEGQKQGFEFFEFPNLGLFLEALKERAIVGEQDEKVIDTERSLLILELLKRAEKSSFTRLLEKVQDENYKMSEEKQMLLDGYLLRQLRAYGLDQKSYSHFIEQAKFSEKFSRVDRATLIDEVDQLSLSMMQKIAAGDEEKLQLIQFSRHLKLMKKMIELKVIPSEVEYYEKYSEGFSSAKYLNFLRAKAKKYGFSFRPSSKIVIIDDVMEIASDFYRYADARSKILVANSVNQLEFFGEDIVGLVAGGFHTEGITKILKKRGYSFMVVTPQIKPPDIEIPYLERMMMTKSPAEVRFEAGFNTLAARNVLAIFGEVAKRGLDQGLESAHERDAFQQIWKLETALVAEERFRDDQRPRPLSKLADLLDFHWEVKTTMGVAGLGQEIYESTYHVKLNEAGEYNGFYLLLSGKGLAFDYSADQSTEPTIREDLSVVNEEIGAMTSAHPDFKNWRLPYRDVFFGIVEPQNVQREVGKLNTTSSVLGNLRGSIAGFLFDVIEVTNSREAVTALFHRNLDAVFSAFQGLFADGSKYESVSGRLVLTPGHINDILAKVSPADFVKMLSGSYEPEHPVNQLPRRLLGNRINQQEVFLVLDKTLETQLEDAGFFNESFPENVQVKRSSASAGPTRVGREMAIDITVRTIAGEKDHSLIIASENETEYSEDHNVIQFSGGAIRDHVPQAFDIISFEKALALERAVQVVSGEAFTFLSAFGDIISQLQGTSVQVLEMLQEAFTEAATQAEITTAA